MTDGQAERAARMRRLYEAEVAAQVPHNRKPIVASLQALRRRKQRRAANAAYRRLEREWVPT